MTILKGSTFMEGDTVEVYKDHITKLLYDGKFILKKLLQVTHLTKTMQVETWEGLMEHNAGHVSIERKFLAGRPL